MRVDAMDSPMPRKNPVTVDFAPMQYGNPEAYHALGFPTFIIPPPTKGREAPVNQQRRSEQGQFAVWRRLKQGRLTIWDQELDRSLVFLRAHMAFREHSQIGTDAKRHLLEELKEAFDEASEENWDGYGAKPANPKAYHYAQKFLDYLDAESLPDEVCALPSGEMAFDWIESHGGLTLSVDSDGQLAFAGDIDSAIHIKGMKKLSVDTLAIISCWIKSVRG